MYTDDILWALKSQNSIYFGLGVARLPATSGGTRESQVPEAPPNQSPLVLRSDLEEQVFLGCELPSTYLEDSKDGEPI